MVDQWLWNHEKSRRIKFLVKFRFRVLTWRGTLYHYYVPPWVCVRDHTVVLLLSTELRLDTTRNSTNVPFQTLAPSQRMAPFVNSLFISDTGSRYNSHHINIIVTFQSPHQTQIQVLIVNWTHQVMKKRCCLVQSMVHIVACESRLDSKNLTKL